MTDGLQHWHLLTCSRLSHRPHSVFLPTSNEYSAIRSSETRPSMNGRSRMKTKQNVDTSSVVYTIWHSSYPPKDIRDLSLYIFPFVMVSSIASPAHLFYGLQRTFHHILASEVNSPQPDNSNSAAVWIVIGGAITVGCVCYAGLWYLWFLIPRKVFASERWAPARTSFHEITLCYTLLALGLVWVAFSTNLPFAIVYSILRNRMSN